MGIEVEPNSSLQSIEYTYTENTYEVVEKANKNLTSVKSDVYLQDISGQYVLESSIITDVNQDDIMVTKEEDGEIARDPIKMKSTSICW